MRSNKQSRCGLVERGIAGMLARYRPSGKNLSFVGVDHLQLIGHRNENK